jgi:hypothetical protein
MIQNKTRIRLTWYSAFIIPVIVVFAIHKEMNDVASAGILAFTGIIGGYIAGKTINNQAYIKNGSNAEK